MNGGIEGKAKIGVAWSAATAAAGQALSFVIGVALARLLSPEDFGIFAAIIVFLEIGSSCVSSGLVSALIQHQATSPRHYSTAFVAQLVLAIAICAIFLAVSTWVGDFFHSPVAGQVLAVLSVYFLILPFISIPTAFLRRQIDFRSTGLADAVQQLVSGSVAVLLAWLGWGVWSLVYGRLIGYGMSAAQLAYCANWRPQLDFDRAALRDLLPFSMRVTLANIVNDVAAKIDYVLVGRLLGPVQLGLYHRAYYLMTLPLNRVTSSLNVVLYPAFSQLQHDERALKESLLKATCYASLFGFPAVVGLFWIAPGFVISIYGEAWSGSVTPLRIMCAAGLLLIVEPIAVSAIIAKGFVGVEVKRQLIYFCALLLGVTIGSYWGIVGVACGVSLASALFFVLLQRLLWSCFGLTWKQYAAVLAPASRGCLALSFALALYQLVAAKAFGAYSITTLATSVSLGTGVYFAYLLRDRDRWSHGPAAKVLQEVEEAARTALEYVTGLCKSRGSVPKDSIH
jgi:PST family polysaccharide transporter